MKFVSTTVLSFLMLLSFASHAQEFGKASYIDLAFQGGKTASGEMYDGNQFTAAHKLHPFGTRLKVTRQDNGRSVVVRVNDRGPHIKGRIVDVSYAAAKSLDMVRDGVVDVRLEVVSKGSNTPAVTPTTTEQPNDFSTNPGTNNASNTPSNTTPPSTETDNNSTSASPSNTSEPANSGTTNTQTPPKPITNNQTSDYSERLLKTNYEKFGLYEIKILQVNKAGFGVQIASLSSYENAMKQLTQLQAKEVNNALLSIEPKEFGGMAFKVIVGPFNDREEAKKQAARLKRLLKVSGFVVDLGAIGN